MKTDYLWATGICSVHQQPNPLCGICNPQIARLQAEINRLKAQVQGGRGNREPARELIAMQKCRIKGLEAEVDRLGRCNMQLSETHAEGIAHYQASIDRLREALEDIRDVAPIERQPWAIAFSALEGE